MPKLERLANFDVTRSISLKMNPDNLFCNQPPLAVSLDLQRTLDENRSTAKAKFQWFTTDKQQFTFTSSKLQASRSMFKIATRFAAKNNSHQAPDFRYRKSPPDTQS